MVHTREVISAASGSLSGYRNAYPRSAKFLRLRRDTVFVGEADQIGAWAEITRAPMRINYELLMSQLGHGRPMSRRLRTTALGSTSVVRVMVARKTGIVEGFRTPASHWREGMHGGRRPKSLEGGNRGGVRTDAGVDLWGICRRCLI